MYIPDEPKSDYMVCDEFCIVLAGLFEAKDENNELLKPVGHLHEVVSLEFRFHVPVGVVWGRVNSGSTARDGGTDLSRNTWSGTSMWGAES